VSISRYDESEMSRRPAAGPPRRRVLSSRNRIHFAMSATLEFTAPAGATLSRLR
jgi:hypothetical protein